MRLVAHVVGMGKRWSVKYNFGEKIEGKAPLGKPKRGWENSRPC